MINVDVSWCVLVVVVVVMVVVIIAVFGDDSIFEAVFFTITSSRDLEVWVVGRFMWLKLLSYFANLAIEVMSNRCPSTELIMAANLTRKLTKNGSR